MVQIESKRTPHKNSTSVETDSKRSKILDSLKCSYFAPSCFPLYQYQNSVCYVLMTTELNVTINRVDMVVLMKARRAESVGRAGYTQMWSGDHVSTRGT